MAEEYTNVEVEECTFLAVAAIIVLGLIAIGGLAFGWNASSKLDSTQQAVNTQVKAMQTSVDQDMSSLKDRLAQAEKTNTDFQGDLKVVTGKLKITQANLRRLARKQPRPIATRREAHRAGQFRPHRTRDEGRYGRSEERDTKVGWRSHGSRLDSRRPENGPQRNGHAHRAQSR